MFAENFLLVQALSLELAVLTGALYRHIFTQLKFFFGVLSNKKEQASEKVFNYSKVLNLVNEKVNINEYHPMPFGLVNEPATYQRLMEECFDELHLSIHSSYILMT